MTGRRRTIAANIAVAVSAAMLAHLFAADGGHAQAIGLPGQNREIPIEINADEGIEWQRDARAYIARGNARAVQGNVAIHAETLIAYYRDGANGGTEIWRMDAEANVRVVSPDQTAFGDKAVYDVTRGVLVLTGNTRLITPEDRITARDSLEYWEKRALAVARGNAVAIRGEKRLRADVLTAKFKRGKDGKSHLSRIEAFDNVLISSPTEIVRANQAVYNVSTGIAILTGSVKITRGKNQINGEKAEVNLNTGVSRMLSGGKGPVRGVFIPEQGRKGPRRIK